MMPSATYNAISPELADMANHIKLLATPMTPNSATTSGSMRRKSTTVVAVSDIVIETRRNNRAKKVVGIWGETAENFPVRDLVFR